MAITKIHVTAHIMTDRLFAEEGYDVERSAENLADLQGEIITDYLAGIYPEAEVYADIGIHRTSDRASSIEVEAHITDQEIDQAVSADLQNQLAREIVAGTADYAWAVRRARPDSDRDPALSATHPRQGGHHATLQSLSDRPG